jgi:hypothetical protein
MTRPVDTNEKATMNQPEQIFLTEPQVDELTGIRRGDSQNGVKRSKFQLQVAFLRTRGIAFIENARGKPIITRSAIEGRRQEPPPRKGWQPQAVRA